MMATLKKGVPAWRMLELYVPEVVQFTGKTGDFPLRARHPTGVSFVVIQLTKGPVFSRKTPSEIKKKNVLFGNSFVNNPYIYIYPGPYHIIYCECSPRAIFFCSHGQPKTP